MVEVILICLGVAVGIGIAMRIDSEPKDPSTSAGATADAARDPSG